MNEKEIKDVIDTYSKFSNEQLMDELVRQVAMQKARDGGESMRAALERIKPLLNEAQRKRIESIMRDADKGR